MRRILSFAVFLFVLCLLAIPMPSRTAPPGTAVLQPAQARIDWLESNANSCCVEPRVDLAIGGRKFVQGEDLRASIDEDCAQCSSEATATLSPPTVRLAQVIVNQLLPATAGAQTVATATPQRSHGHGVLIAIILILLFLAIGAGSWFLSKRGTGSGFNDPSGPSGSANKRAT